MCDGTMFIWCSVYIVDWSLEIEWFGAQFESFDRVGVNKVFGCS